MNFTTRNTTDFLTLLNYLDQFDTELVYFECREHDVHIQMLDSSRLALVDVQLDELYFSEYNCEQQMTIGIALTKLLNIVRLANDQKIVLQWSLYTLELNVYVNHCRHTIHASTEHQQALDITSLRSQCIYTIPPSKLTAWRGLFDIYQSPVTFIPGDTTLTLTMQDETGDVRVDGQIEPTSVPPELDTRCSSDDKTPRVVCKLPVPQTNVKKMLALASFQHSISLRFICDLKQPVQCEVETSHMLLNAFFSTWDSEKS